MNRAPKKTPTYLLDSNVFMEAANRYYAFDIAAGFWVGLLQQAKSGQVASIDRVGNEIKKGKDTLTQWTKTHFSQYFLSSNDTDVGKSFGEMMTWVQGQQQFAPHAKAEFAEVADSWIIAYAHARKAIVVTHEEYSRDAQRKVPMPNVCRAFNVPYIDTYELMRRTGIQLSLIK